MEIARMIITVVLLIVSVLMIVVVLMQQSKESGLGAAFGGESSALSQKGRAASKEAKLRKMTVALAIILGVLAIVMMALPGTSVF